LWSFRATAAVLFVVTTVSGAALWHVVAGAGDAGYDELAEVPMMASIYAVMVWGARRREDARQKLERSVEREHDFVRDASQLLRTPITVAAGHTELIRESAGGTRSETADVLEELRHRRRSRPASPPAQRRRRNFLARRRSTSARSCGPANHWRRQRRATESRYTPRVIVADRIGCHSHSIAWSRTH
jgi:signal transduction histidine kinase